MNHLLTPESYKEKLGEIDGVTDVTWLDDAVDVKQPLETQDTEIPLKPIIRMEMHCFPSRWMKKKQFPQLRISGL